MRSPYRSSLFRDKLSAGWYVLAEFRAFTCNGGTNTQGRPYTPKLYVSSFMTRHRRTLYLQFYKVSRRFDVQRVELFVDIKIPPKVPSFPVITQTTSPELFRKPTVHRPSRLRSLFTRFCEYLDMNLAKDLKVIRRICVRKSNSDEIL